jgi:hypothetical protein
MRYSPVPGLEEPEEQEVGTGHSQECDEHFAELGHAGNAQVRSAPGPVHGHESEPYESDVQPLPAFARVMVKVWDKGAKAGECGGHKQFDYIRAQQKEHREAENGPYEHMRAPIHKK